MSYMEHVSLVLALSRSVKTNNFSLYGHCLLMMPDLFFCYGGQNYARYMTYLEMHIANLESSHPGALDKIKLGAFSVARSLIPRNRCAVDKPWKKLSCKTPKSMWFLEDMDCQASLTIT